MELLDIFMPEIDGIRFCARCQAAVPLQFANFKSSNQTISLGFCSDDCLSKFNQAIVALRRAI